MRTWEIKDDKRKCYFCGSVEGDPQSWRVESAGEVLSENWKKELRTFTKLVKVTRAFSKEDQFFAYVCFRCMALLQIAEDRENFRYGFNLAESEPEIEKPEEKIVEQEKPAEKPEKEITESAEERKEETGGEEKKEESSEEKKEEIKE